MRGLKMGGKKSRVFVVSAIHACIYMRVLKNVREKSERATIIAQFFSGSFLGLVYMLMALITV